MSVVLFAGPPGRVAVLRGHNLQGVLPPLVKVTDSFVGGASNATSVADAFQFEVRRTIVTHVQVSKRTNHQFLHTLGGDVHIYVFGDRMGQLVVGGIAAAVACRFPGGCNLLTPSNPSTTSATFGGEHGLEFALDWYNQKRLSRNPDPVQVFIGKRTLLRGFLTGFDASVMNIDERLVQFSLSLNLIPE